MDIANKTITKTVSIKFIEQLLQQNCNFDFSKTASLFQQLAQNTTLSATGKPHKGLLSSKNLKTDDHKNLVGIWLQEIDPDLGKNEGRIAEHSHKKEKIDEILILDRNTYYAHMQNKVGTIAHHGVHFIPAGVVHGSNTEPSYGRWISIKFHATQ